ncbi:MAG: hypothetical protein HY536_01180 [Candidatus Colwellbacteria bacterium]|nr:hypothetical protein [Candidatus Colwellbacteria bacterium]
MNDWYKKYVWFVFFLNLSVTIGIFASGVVLWWYAKTLDEVITNGVEMQRKLRTQVDSFRIKNRDLSQRLETFVREDRERAIAILTRVLGRTGRILEVDRSPQPHLYEASVYIEEATRRARILEARYSVDVRDGSVKKIE